MSPKCLRLALACCGCCLVWIQHAMAQDGPASAAMTKPEPNERLGGKPTAPIAIGHAELGVPVAGRGLEIVLTFESRVALSDVHVSLAASDDLVLGQPGPSAGWARLEANAPVDLTVVVTPVTFDVHYLTVVVTGLDRGRPQARSVMVPIRLGPRRPRPVAPLERDQSGRSLRALPASETVR